MKIIQWTIILISITLAALSGCAKIPEKLVSPAVKIDSVIGDNLKLYSLKLSAGIVNENSDVTLVNMKGNIIFLNIENSEGKKISMPFEIPVILPYSTAIIIIEKQFPESSIMTLADILRVDKEKIINKKGVEETYIDEKHIDLEIISYEKKDILDLLKGKLDEKD